MKITRRCDVRMNMEFITQRIEASPEAREAGRRCSPRNRPAWLPAWTCDRRCAQTEGGAILEFALMLPILALIMMGILTFGVALNNYLQICDGVNLAAKQLAIEGDTDTDNCATAAATIAGATTGLNTAFQGTSSVTITVKIGSTSYGSSCAGAMNSATLAGETATLTATYPCAVVLGITSSTGVNWLNSTNCTLSAYTEELIQ